MKQVVGHENGDSCQDWRSWGSLYHNIPDAERNYVDYASYIVSFSLLLELETSLIKCTQ
jgi:hypothetical protein